MSKITEIQTILGVSPDGIWGPKSQAAFDALIRSDNDWHDATASSFADPEDVRVYRECIADGHSKAYCLKRGDNGVGCWGDDTTGATPACALNKKHIIGMWGSMEKGKHKRVEVSIDDQIVDCILKDTGAPVSRVDLNPGAVAAFNLSPPVLVKARWRWA